MLGAGNESSLPLYKMIPQSGRCCRIYSIAVAIRCTSISKQKVRSDTVVNELEKVLAEQIADMKVNDITACATEMHSVYLDRTEKDNSKWLELITEALKIAKNFEIHCWNEENDWIDVALQYGELKESDWKYGKIIKGNVTPEFLTMILDMPKPADVEIYNKMTPFLAYS